MPVEKHQLYFYGATFANLGPATRPKVPSLGLLAEMIAEDRQEREYPIRNDSDIEQRDGL